MKVQVGKCIDFIAWIPHISRDNAVDIYEAFVSPSPVGECYIGPEFSIDIYGTPRLDLRGNLDSVTWSARQFFKKKAKNTFMFSSGFKFDLLPYELIETNPVNILPERSGDCTVDMNGPDIMERQLLATGHFGASWQIDFFTPGLTRTFIKDIISDPNGGIPTAVEVEKKSQLTWKDAEQNWDTVTKVIQRFTETPNVSPLLQRFAIRNDCNETHPMSYLGAWHSKPSGFLFDLKTIWKTYEQGLVFFPTEPLKSSLKAWCSVYGKRDESEIEGAKARADAVLGDIKPDEIETWKLSWQNIWMAADSNDLTVKEIAGGLFVCSRVPAWMYLDSFYLDLFEMAQRSVPVQEDVPKK